MTEQEAEALAARLTKVWVPSSPQLAWWEVDGRALRFWAIVDLGVDVVYHQNTRRSINLTRDVLRAQTGLLSWHEGLPDISTTDNKAYYMDREAQYAQFAVQWLPFFRRGCWLSGCPIEATAHEKAEWIQGFTREEIEAWNLKF